MLISGNRDTTSLVWDLTGKLAAKETWRKPLTAQELEDAWAVMAKMDAARAYDALRRLSVIPDQAIPYLKKHIPPVAVADEKRLVQLIAELAVQR